MATKAETIILYLCISGTVVKLIGHHKWVTLMDL